MTDDLTDVGDPVDTSPEELPDLPDDVKDGDVEGDE
jgi:hypothetical protein